MKRWRCTKRACRRKGWVRKSTKKLVAPACPRCGKKMTIDHYRTSKRDSRARGLCFCKVVSFEPHRRGYCRKVEIQQYEESCREPYSA